VPEISIMAQAGRVVPEDKVCLNNEHATIVIMYCYFGSYAILIRDLLATEYENVNRR